MARQPEQVPDRQIGGAVGNQNDERLKRFNEIADSADAVRADDLVDIEETTRRSPQQPDPDDEPEQAVEGDEQDYADPHAGKRMLKINGKELWFTDEEIMARASKVEAADQYLQSSAEALKRSMDLASPPQRDEPEPDEFDADRVMALARALQVGTEEEAAEAIRAIVKRPSAVTPDDVVRRVDQRLSLREELALLESKHADILGHEVLGDVFRLRLNQLKQSAPGTNVSAAYEQITNGIREQFAPMLRTAPTTQTKAQRKAQMSSVPSAAGRQMSQADDEPSDDPESVIAAMAKARNQGRPITH